MIALVKSSMRSRRQHDSSGLGLWSTNTSRTGFTPSSEFAERFRGLPAFDAGSCRLHSRRCGSARWRTATFLERRRDEGKPYENSPGHICGILSVIRYLLRQCNSSPFVTQDQFLESSRVAACRLRILFCGWRSGWQFHGRVVWLSVQFLNFLDKRCPVVAFRVG